MSSSEAVDQRTSLGESASDLQAGVPCESFSDSFWCSTKASWVGGWCLEHFLWPKHSMGMEAVMAYCVTSEALTPL